MNEAAPDWKPILSLIAHFALWMLRVGHVVTNLLPVVSQPHGSGHQGAPCFAESQTSTHKGGGEVRNGSQGSGREGPRCLANHSSEPWKAKHHRSRKDMKWRNAPSFILYCIPQIFVEDLLCARHVLSPWGIRVNKTDKVCVLTRAHFREES